MWLFSKFDFDVNNGSNLFAQMYKSRWRVKFILDSSVRIYNL